MFELKKYNTKLIMILKHNSVTYFIIPVILFVTIEAKPECESNNNGKEVICHSGQEDFKLERGLISDNNRTTSITLRSCRIIDVEYESFNDLFALKYLDLSRNKIIRLKLGVLDEPKQLTNLNLSYNVLTELPLGIFDQTTKIEYLDLRGNKINNLDLGIFDPLKMLKYLDLSSNSLHGESLNPYIFDQSPHITFIDFSRNNMSDSPDHMLQAFQSLEILNLDRTFLKEVPAFATKENLKTMKHLILSTNQISSLDDATIFINLDNLGILDLSYNAIERINGDVLTPLKNLQKIVLRNNRLKIIPENLFRNMPRLITIHLLGNVISDVPVNAFRGTPLRNLNLSNNRITYLVDNFCLELKNSGGRLKKFLFEPNPWQCACLNDLIKEVKRLGIEYNSDKYDGKTRVCVTTNEYTCKRHQTFNNFYIDLYKGGNKLH